MSKVGRLSPNIFEPTRPPIEAAQAIAQTGCLAGESSLSAIQEIKKNLSFSNLKFSAQPLDNTACQGAFFVVN
jgi:hypothetical protein